MNKKKEGTQTVIQNNALCDNVVWGWGRDNHDDLHTCVDTSHSRCHLRMSSSTRHIYHRTCMRNGCLQDILKCLRPPPILVAGTWCFTLSLSFAYALLHSTHIPQNVYEKRFLTWHMAFWSDYALHPSLWYVMFSLQTIFTRVLTLYYIVTTFLLQRLR